MYEQRSGRRVRSGQVVRISSGCDGCLRTRARIVQLRSSVYQQSNHVSCTVHHRDVDRMLVAPLSVNQLQPFLLITIRGCQYLTQPSKQAMIPLLLNKN